jgi:glycine cleavage system H protein
MIKIDNELRYSKDHLWVRKIADGEYQAGITDYAQDLLGDIVFVEFPLVGSVLQANQPCGLVESVKTGSDLHAPLDGAVTQINTTLQVNPEQINDAPYKTWIFTFTATDESAINDLLDAQAYQALTA